MGLQSSLYASKDGERVRWLIDAHARSTSEAMAAALGLVSAYGVADPEEPGNYLNERVDASKIRWEDLAQLKGCEWKEGINADRIRELVEEGWTLVYSPSY